jgi:hypothetical protein
MASIRSSAFLSRLLSANCTSLHTNVNSNLYAIRRTKTKSRDAGSNDHGHETRTGKRWTSSRSEEEG